MRQALKQTRPDMITTSTSASAAKPAGKQTEYPDSRIPGLALRVTEAGRSHGHFATELRRVSSADRPSVAIRRLVSEARARATQALGGVASLHCAGVTAIRISPLMVLGDGPIGRRRIHSIC